MFGSAHIKSGSEQLVNFGADHVDMFAETSFYFISSPGKYLWSTFLVMYSGESPSLSSSLASCMVDDEDAPLPHHSLVEPQLAFS